MKLLILHAETKDGRMFDLRHNFANLTDDCYEISRAGLSAAEARLKEIIFLSLLVKTDEESVPCPQCSGTGADVSIPFDTCFKCGGSGWILESEAEK